ncbi:MAG: DUF4124 domain-containing protein [Gammaproteobacteria bacterium]|nr:DUF4124 domain-containing protein [Gammaproteobacteria bacterium]
MKSPIGQIISFSLIVTLSFIFTQPVFAEKTTEIYKWVDKDGKVNYAARPGDSSAKKMHMGSNIFHKQKKQDQSDAKNKESDERAKLCQDSKDTLAKYKKAPFLYRYDEERKQKIRLTESEAKESFLQAEKDVSYWCNPPQAPEDEKE